MAELGLFDQVYNPDVLSCLANLSNDEVFTPPEVANAMLPIVPPPVTNTLLPATVIGLLTAWRATASGSIIAPCPSSMPSGKRWH